MRYCRPNVLVRWAGLDAAGDTWELLDNLDLGAALVGRTLLYWWPDDGWQRGTVALLCPRGVFSHVVA